MGTDLLDIDAAIANNFPEEIAPEKDDAAGDGTEEVEETVESDDASEKGGEKEDDDPGSLISDGVKKDDVGDIDKEKTETLETKPKEKRSDRRVNELLKERYALRRENEELKSKVKPKAIEPPKKPNPKDYKYNPDDPKSIEEAQRKYDFDNGKYESELKGHEEKVVNQKKERENKELNRIKSEQDEYGARIEKGKLEYADYDEAFANIKNTFEMTEALHTSLLDSEDPAGLLRFLGKNTAIAEKVLSYNTTRQAITLAKIDAKLILAKDRKIVRVSKAPAPTAKVKGGRTGGKKDPRKMSAEEHYKTYYKNAK